MRETVRRANQRQLAQARLLQLLADSGERLARIEALGEDIEERRSLLERLHQAAVGADLLGAHLVKQAGGTAEEQPPFVVRRLVEGSADDDQERTLPVAERRLVEVELG